MSKSEKRCKIEYRARDKLGKLEYDSYEEYRSNEC